MNTITPIIKTALIINIGCYFAQYFLGLDIIEHFGLRCVSSPYFRPYQFVTHMFVHASFAHLFSNMFALFTFGPILEQRLNPQKFLIFYLFTGLGAATLSSIIQYADVHRIAVLYYDYISNPNPHSFQVYLSHFSDKLYNAYYPFSNEFFDYATDPERIAKSKSIARQLFILKTDIPTVGASGVVFGLLTAFAMLFPNAELFLFFIPIPIKAKYFVILYGVYELYAGIQQNGSDNVAHFAHLGGILFGYLFIKWWRK